jgi:hypothetical protein
VVNTKRFALALLLSASACKGPAETHPVAGAATDESWWRVAPAAGTQKDPVAWFNEHPRQDHQVFLDMTPSELIARRQASITTPNWSTMEMDTINSTSAIYVAGATVSATTDRVVFEHAASTSSHSIYVVDTNGALKAQQAISGKLDGTAMLLSLDGSVAYAADTAGKLYAVKLADGTSPWGGSKSLSAGVSWATPWLDFNTPYTIYVVDTTGTPQAFDAATGAAKYATPTSATGNSPVHSSPVLWNGILWFGADNGNLYRVNPSTGAVLGSTNLCLHGSGSCSANDAIYSAPFIDSANNLLLIGVNKRLVQVSIDPSTGCTSTSCPASAFTYFTLDDGAFASSETTFTSTPYAANGFVYVAFDNRLWRATYTNGVAAGSSGNFTRASTLALTSDPTGVMRPWDQNDHSHPKSSPLEFNSTIFLGDGGCNINRFDTTMFSLQAVQDYANNAAVPTSVGPTIDSTPLIDILSGGNIYFSTLNPNSPSGSWVSLSQSFPTEPPTFGVMNSAAGSSVKLWISATASTTAGNVFPLTVAGVDQFNHTSDCSVSTANGGPYHGTIHFTSSDPAAVLPADYTFTSGTPGATCKSSCATCDDGVHTFSGATGIVLKTAGSQTITATDTTNGSVKATWTVQVSGSAAAKLVMTPATVTTEDCTAFTVTVSATDSSGNVITTYNGTVSFMSSDGAATLPASGMLTNGTGMFSVTMRTVGVQTLTVSDNTGLTPATSNVTVQGLATKLVYTDAPASTNGSTNAGTTFTATVQAQDACGNGATGYAGSVRLTSSDAQMTVSNPNPATFTAGTPSHSFMNVDLKTRPATAPFTQTLTATDTANSALTVTATITVNPANGCTTWPQKFGVNIGAAQTVNDPATFTIIAEDNFGNTITGYTGTVTVSVNDTTATFAGPFTNCAVSGNTSHCQYTFQAADNGTKTFTGGVTFETANGKNQSYTMTASGPGTATAACTNNATVNGTNTVTVAAQDLAKYGFTVPGGKIPAGVPASWTLTAEDTNGYQIVDAPFSVSLTSSDPAATFTVPGSSTSCAQPCSYTFQPSDGGAAVFTVTFQDGNTGGKNQTITAASAVQTRVPVAVSSTSGNIKVTSGQLASWSVVASSTSVASGANFNLVLTALDADGLQAGKYRGSIELTSTDTDAQNYPTIPSTVAPFYQFGGNDKGQHTFTNVELLTDGVQTITVHDCGMSTTCSTFTGINGTSQMITVGTGALFQFKLTAPATAASGQLFDCSVTAQDKGGNTISTYSGTVEFRPPTGSNPQGTYPSGPQTLTNGTRTFSSGCALNKSGTQTFYVRDTAQTAIFGSATVTISAGSATHYSLTPSTTTPARGVAFTITVSALDASNLVDTNYGGTVTFTSTDAAALLPSDYIFQPSDAGVHVFTVTINTSGAHTVTGTDTVTASINGTTVTLNTP